MIHAEAVALFNDTWQILHEGESQPASRLTVPAELPQLTPAGFSFPKQELQCLPQAKQQLCCLHLLVTGGLQNKHHPDGW